MKWLWIGIGTILLVFAVLIFIPKPENLSDQEFDSLAEHNLDSRYCSKIQNGTLQDYCFRKIAFWNEDFETCDEISDQRVKDECYLLVSQKTGEYRCTMIIDEHLYYQCSNSRIIPTSLS